MVWCLRWFVGFFKSGAWVAPSVQCQISFYLHHRRWRSWCFHPSLSVCYLQNRRFFQVYWSVDFVILSLSVCLSPTGHNFKPIVTKLHHIGEFVIRRKPIVFEVKRSKGQHWPKVNNFGEISKILGSDWLEIWRGFILQVTEFNQPIIFEVNIDQKVNIVPRSTTKVVFLKSSHFHLIDLKFEEDLYFRSLNSTRQLFLRSTLTERSTSAKGQQLRWCF